MAAAAAAAADTATKYVASNLPATTGTYTNLTVASLGVQPCSYHYYCYTRGFSHE